MAETGEVAVTRKLAEFASRVDFADLPSEVVAQTKDFILDHIGDALCGYTAEPAQPLIAIVMDLGGRPEATIVGSGHRTSTPWAALVNGKLANMADNDEILYNFIHIGGVPIFAALAAAESVKASGKQMIVATALGYDVCARVIIAGSRLAISPEGVPSAPRTMGFSGNAVGAAAAAGKALSLGGEAMAQAMGMAAHFAPLPMLMKWANSFPTTMLKYADFGWVTHCGVMAALLAEKGYNGDPTALDGDHGFWTAAGYETFDFDTFVTGLGEKWYIMDAGFKPYPCCRFYHSALDLFAKIKREHRLAPEDIKRVTLKITPFTAMPVWVESSKWGDLKDRDRVIKHSEFSSAYLIALAAYGVRPGPEWVSPERLKDPKIIEFSKKVSHEPNLETFGMWKSFKGHGSELLKEMPVVVEVESTKGNFSAGTSHVRGNSWDPESKLSPEEIKEKFISNSSKTLGDKHIERIVETVARLEGVDDITRLCRLLSPRLKRGG